MAELLFNIFFWGVFVGGGLIYLGGILLIMNGLQSLEKKQAAAEK